MRKQKGIGEESVSISSSGMERFGRICSTLSESTHYWTTPACLLNNLADSIFCIDFPIKICGESK